MNQKIFDDFIEACKRNVKSEASAGGSCVVLLITGDHKGPGKSMSIHAMMSHAAKRRNC